MILLDRFLLLLNARSLGLQDSKLLFFAQNFLVTLLVLLFQLCNVLVTGSHHLSIVVEESRILDQRLLQFVIFFAQFRLSRLELKLLLRKVLLLGQVSLLILIHLAPLVEKARRWRHSVQLLGATHAFLFHHLLTALFRLEYLL